MPLTETQITAARMLASGHLVRDVSSHLGINRTTIYRWRKSPEFLDATSKLGEAATRASTDRIVRDIKEINDIVLRTLVDVAENDDSGSARVSASRVLVEMVERAEERAKAASGDLMHDHSREINAYIAEIRADPNR